MKAIVWACLALFAFSACAEDLPTAPSHAFWDKKQDTITGLSLAANTLDAITTQRFLSQHSGIEGDPLAKPFVKQGWPGQLFLSYGVNTAGVVWMQYLAHKTGHHKVERWIGAAQVVAIGSAGLENLKLWNNSPTGIPFQPAATGNSISDARSIQRHSK